jgi:hypothetical protein
LLAGLAAVTRAAAGTQATDLSDRIVDRTDLDWLLDQWVSTPGETPGA